MVRRVTAVACLLALAPVGPVLADSTDASCVVFSAGSDHSENRFACRFYQAQGHVVISRADGVEHDLTPVGASPGQYSDAQGNPVYRQSGLGDQGLIFRFPDESVYVYWNSRRLEPADDSNPTWPYATADFDATALFRCKRSGDTAFGNCPGGILRMDGGQASIVVLGPTGEEFTINFMSDYVNATNRDVKARLQGDTWVLEFTNGEVWEVPRAAVEGG
jgi:hypothetical protein